MSAKRSAILVTAAFCCVTIVSCLGPGPQEQVNDTAWTEARDLAADWPDEPAQMTVEQLTQVEAADAAVTAALTKQPDNQELADIESRVRTADEYLNGLRASVAADVAAAERECLVERTFFHECLSALWADRHADWEKAAALGWPDGQWLMGHCYHMGVGVDVDYARALELYRQAAVAGHLLAINHLGYMYDAGQGVPLDKAEAVRLYRQAAEAGCVVAMHNMAAICDDLSEELQWRRRAAEGGSVLNMWLLGMGYRYGRSTLDIPKDSAEAAIWLSRAAEAGHVSCMTWLAQMYRDGEGVEQDQAAADMWFRRAAEAYREHAEAGVAYSMRALAEMYRDGEGVEQDQATADAWMQRAVEAYESRADAGDVSAMRTLGDIYSRAFHE